MKELSYGEFSLKTHHESLHANRFIKAQFELTYACNLHCVHCYTDPLNRPDKLRSELSFEEACSVLDKLASENIFWLCFTGGEIFMRKDFLKIYDYAHEKGFLITLFTNATLISDSLADHLAEKRPFCIEISIYGATEETYENVTQVKGSFNRFESGVRRLAQRELPLKFKTTLMTLNAHEMIGMKSFAEKFQAPFNMSSLIYPRLDGDISSTRYRLSATEILQLTFGDPETETGCAEEVPSVEVAADPRLYRCGCGKLNAHIDPYGKVGTCTWARRDRFDFREHGVQSGMQEIAQTIQGQYYTENSPCFSCTAVAFCNKSPEMAVYENGDAQKPVEHFCEVAFATADKFKMQTQH